MTIKAVIFDIGGVLFQIQDLTLYRQWATRLGISEGQLGEIIFNNPVSRRATVGEATTEEVWNEVGKRLALPPDDLAALKVDIWRGGVWDTELLDFIRLLRPQYKTGIISDAWPDAREMVKEYVNSDIFDVIVFSAEEGLEKPNPEIYRRALSRLEVAPQQAIFIDDRLPNVVNACLIGIHAIHFTNSLEAREVIERTILSQLDE